MRKFQYVLLLIIFVGLLGAIWWYYYVNNIGRELIPVNVGIVTWAGIGPGYVGIEKGFFNDLKVEMRILEDTNARYAAYASSDLTMMLTTADQHSREFEQGLPGRLFLITDMSNGSDGMVASKDIQEVKDLVGKRIAYPVGTASDYLLHKLLEGAGVERTEVVLRTVDDPNAAIAAFNSGQVDAAVAWEPLLSETVASGRGHILATSADIPGVIITTFVAKNDFTQNSAAVKIFLDGWFKAIEFMKSNPAEANEIIAKGLNIKADEVKGMMDGIKIGDLQLNKEHFCVNASGEIPLAKVVTDAALYWKSINVLKNLPSSKERLAPSSEMYFCKE